MTDSRKSLETMRDSLACPVLRRFVNDMVDVDGQITRSAYGTGPADGCEDRPPTGDDYNALWGACIHLLVMSPKKRRTDR